MVHVPKKTNRGKQLKIESLLDINKMKKLSSLQSTVKRYLAKRICYYNKINNLIQGHVNSEKMKLKSVEYRK